VFIKKIDKPIAFRPCHIMLDIGSPADLEDLRGILQGYLSTKDTGPAAELSSKLLKLLNQNE
jgi:hypothetical protein